MKINLGENSSDHLQAKMSSIIKKPAFYKMTIGRSEAQANKRHSFSLLRLVFEAAISSLQQPGMYDMVGRPKDRSARDINRL